MTMLDTTQEIPVAAEAAGVDSAAVRTRAVAGVKALTARTTASVLLRVVSSLALARLLFPKDYGVFAITAYITGLGMFLCDVGLGGALVRQSQKPSRNEAFTVFWSQQAITTLVVFAVIATAPLLEHAYRLSGSTTGLLVAMALGLFLSSLRVVPMMALERDLQFPTIARCELIENVAQTGSTILLAALGCGPWALVGGGLIRGVVGLTCVWLASPWRPQGRFEWETAKRLARFGIPFQLNALVPSLVGGWMPLIVGRVLGVAAVGLVGWATNIASVPMMLSGVLNRVAFPAYSRLQSDPAALGHYLRASLRRVGAVLCLIVPLIVIACPAAVPGMFGNRWIPAIPLVQWFSLETILLILTGLLASTQNALGHAGERLAVTIGVGVVRWVCGYVAIRHFGLLGIGQTMFLVSFGELVIMAALVKRHDAGSARLLWEVFEPLLSTGLMLGLALALGLVLGHGRHLQTVISLATFVVLMSLREALTGGRVLVHELRRLFVMLRPALEQPIV